MKTQPFEINAFTEEGARNAVKDILRMYWDMKDSPDGFGPDTDTGSFNPFLFLKATATEEVDIPKREMILLHEGSAVKILCWLAGAAAGENAAPHPESWLGRRVAELVGSDSLDHLPEAKSAVNAIAENSDYSNDMARVYDAYVAPHFNAVFRSAN